MATGPLPSIPHGTVLTDGTSSTPRHGGQQDQAEQFVRMQIERTRRKVKLLELSTALLNLLGVAVSYLLVLIVVDHWVIGLSGWARWLAFAVLVGGLLVYAQSAIWPLLRHAIHPLYAARSIEQGAPQLKNSLINYLLLRTQVTALPEAICDTLAVQAAQDLSSIPLEQSVDRARLIKIGYVLAGLLALILVYTILSPKAPLPSAMRVVAPWKEVARPTRIKIVQVTPGDTEVYQGEEVSITAEIEGSVAPEQGVRLIFRSLDGRTVNQIEPMMAAPGEARYRASLPPGPGGVQQDLLYYIEAGDARSAEYHLRVSPAPTIWVEQLEYLYPSYTGLAPETVQRQGDIRALEGTRVTIRARANKPLKTAYIELQPAAVTGLQTTPSAQIDRPTELSSEPSEAGLGEADQTGPDQASKTAEPHANAPATTSRSTNSKTSQPFASDRSASPRADWDELSSGNATRVQTPTDRSPASTPPQQAAPQQASPLRQRQAMQVSGLEATVTLTLELAADRRTPRFQSYQLELVTDRGEANPHPVLHTIEVLPDLPPEIAILTPEAERTPVRQDARQRIEVRAIDPDFGLRSLQLIATVEGRVIWEKSLLEDASGRTGQQLAQVDFVPAELRLAAGTQVAYRAIAHDNRTAPGTDRPEPNVRSTPERFLEVTPRRPVNIPAAAKNPDEGDKKNRSGNSTSGGQTGSSGGGQDGIASESGENGSGEGKAEKGSSGGGQGAASGKPQAGEQGQQQGTGGTPQPGSDPSAGSSGTPQPDASEPGMNDPASQPPGSPPPGGGGTGRSAENQSGSPGQAEPLHDGEVFERALERLRQQGQNSPANSDGTPPRNGETPSTPPHPPASADPARNAGSAANASQPEPTSQPQSEPGSNAASSQSSSGQSPATPPSARAAQGVNPPGSSASQAAGTSPQPETTGAQPKARTDNQPPQANPPDSNEKGGNQGRASADRTAPTPDKQPTANPNSPRAEKPASEPASNNASASAQPASTPATAKPANADAASQKPPPNNPQQPSSSPADKPSSASPADAAPQTPAETNRPTDTQGGDQGDKSGGGKPGPGQSSNQPGKGMPGSNSPADEGAGAAPEPGTGETSGRAGSQQPAPGPTGNAGNQAGAGSQSGAAGNGNRPGSAAPKPPDSTNPSPAGSGAGGAQPGGRSGPTRGGGVPADTPDRGTTQQTWEVAEGDTANLEYAQHATDLVIDYLKNQREQPDPKLLQDLNWTADELRAFLDRWQTLKEAAREGSPAAREQLESSLRSLGLRSSADTTHRDRANVDRLRGLQESGINSAPPPAYRDAFRAFKKGTARTLPPPGATGGQGR